MRGIAGDIAQRRPVGEDAEHPQQAHAPRRAVRGQRLQAGKHQQARQDRAERAQEEGGAPAQGRTRPAREEVGETRADAEGRGVDGDETRLPAAGEPVGQRLQPGHVGAGKAGAGERLEQGRAHGVAGEQGEAQAAGGGQEASEEVDAPGVDAVGESGEYRHGQHVAGEERAADGTGGFAGEMPGFLELRQQARPGGEAAHAQRFGKAKQEQQPAVRETPHSARNRSRAARIVPGIVVGLADARSTKTWTKWPVAAGLSSP